MPQSQLGALIYVLAVEWLIIEKLLIVGANSNDFFYVYTK